MKSDALQQAIYTKLNVAAITGKLSSDYGVSAIFTDVPQADDSELPEFFPYIVIGGDTFTAFDDKDDGGNSVVVQIDVYSRASNMGAVKQIGDEVYAQIFRQPLTIPGVTWITTEFQGVDYTRDPDGLTKRAIMQFSVIYIS